MRDRLLESVFQRETICSHFSMPLSSVVEGVVASMEHLSTIIDVYSEYSVTDYVYNLKGSSIRFLICDPRPESQSSILIIPQKS